MVEALPFVPGEEGAEFGEAEGDGLYDTVSAHSIFLANYREGVGDQPRRHTSSA
jgi:hypothetical protein